MSPIEEFVREAWTLWSVATIVVLFRIWARVELVGWRKLDWDDPLMLMAHVCYTMETIAAWYIATIGRGLANDAMTDDQRASLDPLSEEWRLRVNGSKTHFIGWMVYTALLWLLKACWLIYYMRLTNSLHSMRWQIRFGWLFLGTTYITSVLMVICKCLPVTKQWQIYPNPGNHCQPGNAHIMFIFVMVINAATDLYLMAIPLPMIYKSRIELKKKITLLVLFSGGFLVISFGILRCITLLTAGPLEGSKSGPWSIRESFMAVAVSNLPMIFPLFKTWYHRARGEPLNTESSMGCSYPLGSNPRTHAKGSRHLHTSAMPDTMPWNSQEAIMPPHTKVIIENTEVPMDSTESFDDTGKSMGESGGVGMMQEISTTSHVADADRHDEIQEARVAGRSSWPPQVQITVHQEYSVEVSDRKIGEGGSHSALIGHDGN